MKDVTCRSYTDIPGITDDYFKVRDFFVERGYCEFTYARWDWMITHSYLAKDCIAKIGIWEEKGKVVAVATFDTEPGETFLVMLPGYESLEQEMLLYAKRELNINQRFSLVISDTNLSLQSTAAKNGFYPIQEKECDSIFYPGETPCAYSLPKGFSMTDMQETFDLYQYGRVLWKGFNHELDGQGAFALSGEMEAVLRAELLRPNVALTLKLAARTPEGNFGAYCGMWYDTRADYAVIEPVATDPDYRKMGLGKAVVLEGIKRACALGAKYVVVGSSQQFYYSIGLRPYGTATKWKDKLV